MKDIVVHTPIKRDAVCRRRGEISGTEGERHHLDFE